MLTAAVSKTGITKEEKQLKRLYILRRVCLRQVK